MGTAPRDNVGLDSRTTRQPGERIPGAVASLIAWVGVGLLVLLFMGVLAGIWMVLVQGNLLPLEAVCLRG